MLRITSYDLSCLTRFRFCLTLPDVLPEARSWHFYPSVERDPEPPDPTGPPAPCDIPVFALSRDAEQVLEVHVISEQITHEVPSYGYPNGRDLEQADAELLAVLKGDSAAAETQIVLAPYAYDFNYPWEASETLVRDKRYFIFLNSEPGFPQLHMNRCGEAPDTPEVRAQIAKGLAQDDSLRRAEPFGGSGW